ncbi:hypothetical protein PV396_19600 [Streptomyces sp. ME02-8801-2C]|uniref:hypothetical protein n=1 Tax=Streptomyces sp. ME02-8801-2C TaxID=3028680 RepID=UPI0029BB8520|nr:hypothetical protein [Streptomyces sp. ME02-8801-2C]MDX3454121.1 hypothetical protein [Streptomyces sp. ME02-8801-2C]
MTSTTDPAGHPDVTELSDLTEGLLTPSRTADVRRHLNECILCADVYVSLEEIRGLLGSVPSPVHMPDDVADRIGAALAAEAAMPAGVPGEMEHVDVSRETSTPADRHPSRPTGHAHAATGPGRKDRAQRGRRRTVVLGTVFTAAALGIGSLLVSSLGDDNKQPEAASTFAGQKIESQVAELLKGTDVKKGPRSGKPSVGIESHTGEPGTNEHEGLVKSLPTAVPDCVMEGIGRTDTSIIGVKQGAYDGTDAYLVVLPAAGDSTRVTAYVVDSACAKQPSTPPGKVLLTRSYARS